MQMNALFSLLAILSAPAFASDIVCFSVQATENEIDNVGNWDVFVNRLFQNALNKHRCKMDSLYEVKVLPGVKPDNLTAMSNDNDEKRVVLQNLCCETKSN